MRVFSVQYNPSDNHSFISGGWDGTIQVFMDSKCNTAGTQRCFNINLTFYGCYKRYMDVETMFCARWDETGSSQL